MSSVIVTKTEVTCFTKLGHIPVAIKMGYSKSNPMEVTEKRCSGVVLDENLTFSNHIKCIAAKATGILAKISVFHIGGAWANSEIYYSINRVANISRIIDDLQIVDGNMCFDTSNTRNIFEYLAFSIGYYGDPI